MSSEWNGEATRMEGTELLYSGDSLRFARRLLGDLEHELKERAKQLTRDAGRDTVTEEDMRQAADEILGPVDVAADA